MKYRITLNGKTYEIEVERGEAVLVDEYDAPVPAVAAAPKAEAAKAAAPAPAAKAPMPAPAKAAAVTEAGTPVTAPLPGTVFRVVAPVGTAVKAGDVVLILEAMKMENEINAPCDGAVKQVVAPEGAAVKTGDTLMVIG